MAGRLLVPAVMGLPPERLDDLRAIARALGHGHTPTPPPSGGPRGWAVAVFGAVVLFLGWAAARTCGFRGCGEAPQIAVRLARAVDPSPAGTEAADAPNAVGALLDRERVVALPIVEPTVVLAPSPAPTPTLRARAWDRVPATPRPRGRRDVLPSGARIPGRERMVVAGAVAVSPRVSATPSRSTRDSGRNLSGAWLVTNTIQESSRGGFRGLRIRFRVELRQDGSRLTGTGRKFTVDDRPVAPGERTPIELEGEIRDDEVVLRFVEHGRWRTTRGAFRWRLSSDGERLVGSFDSTAAASSGVSSARRGG